MNSYKVEVCTNNGIEWSSNAVRFATSDEADKYGFDLSMRWTSVRDYRITPSLDPVNYQWDGAKGLIALD